MKYIISIFIIITLAFNSCSLKEELLDVPTPATIKTETDVTAVINGMYARFNNSSAFKFQGMIMFFLSADDIYPTSAGELLPFGERSFTANNTGGMWNTLFQTIGSANALIKTLDNLNLSDAFEKRAYGEAYFVRAFCFYYLVRMYGGVPLRLDALDIDGNFYLPRSSVDSVYNQIFNDFKTASALLPLYKNISVAELGRASKGAAQSILAQAYLTYGNQLSLKGSNGTQHYENAVLYADSVINSNQYQLLANYKDIFDINKESAAYNEVIYGIRFMTDNQNRAQPAAGSEFALRFGAPNTHLVSGNPPNGAGDGSMRPMPWVADYFRIGDYDTIVAGKKIIDYRNETAFMQRGYHTVQNKYYAIYPNLPASTAEGTVNTPLIGKYIDPSGKDARNNGNDLFIIRFAEVYLIKAEAENELNGPTTGALAAFNTVRARSRKADGITARLTPEDLKTGLTKDQFRMKVFDEREMELIGEGQRWFDLVRMRSPLSASQTMFEYQLKVVLPTYPQTLPTYQTGPKKYSNSFAVYAPQLNISVPKFLLFPIPTSEITQNPKIGPANQNPGW